MAASLFGYSNNRTEDGKPNGGWASGRGFHIEWQRGPLVVNGERRIPNGAFVETIIAAAKQRLEFYQSSPFACQENANAIAHLESALSELDARTARRTDAGTEGTWEGN